DQMRVVRWQRAEEQARGAPFKMVFAMVFLIFPSLFIVILGPSIPRFQEFLQGMTR
ncbi:MAG: type II secretion system F family protein, partial [Anaerolineae bacterium]|nr:type II secretion system F family protein [Anaerolineae bacterium]